eukprot:GSChrysophyteH1.ASY1.ANO1.3204.1 assembled CDS
MVPSSSLLFSKSRNKTGKSLGTSFLPPLELISRLELIFAPNMSSFHFQLSTKKRPVNTKNTTRKRCRQDIVGPDGELPCFLADELTNAEALKFYQRYQVLHIRCPRSASNNKKKQKPLKVLEDIYFTRGPLESSISSTWCLENGGNVAEKAGKKKEITPKLFFTEHPKGSKSLLPSSCYVSCILQGNRTAVDSYLSKCPRSSPPCVDLSNWKGYEHSAPVWLFIGRNLGGESPLQGRPEHTDSVSHDGTWHYQLSGSKVWYVRPMEGAAEWAGDAPSLPSGVSHVRVNCLPDDIFMINTRLWWHRTELPSTINSSECVSMSFARDFYCGTCALPGEAASGEDAEQSYTNVDGIYAQTNVKRGEVVLRESEMPDCELPRSSCPNCEVGELGDGEGCIAAIRDIPAGEWFSIAPSDSESSGTSNDTYDACSDEGEEEEEN